MNLFLKIKFFIKKHAIVILAILALSFFFIQEKWQKVPFGKDNFGNIEKTLFTKLPSSFGELKREKIKVDISKYRKDVVTISNFNEEDWQIDNGNMDYMDYMSSVRIISQLGVISTARLELEDPVDFKNYTYISFLMDIPIINSVEKIYLKFGDMDFRDFYIIDITPAQLAGYNGRYYMRIPKEDFQYVKSTGLRGKNNNDFFKKTKIEKIEIGVVGVPDQVAEVLFAHLTASKNMDIPYKQINSKSSTAKKYPWKYRKWEPYGGGFEVEKDENNYYLAGWNTRGITLSSYQKQKQISDFEFSAKIILKSRKKAGIFFRGDEEQEKGYFLWLQADDNQWYLEKYQLIIRDEDYNYNKSDILAKGAMNMSLVEDQPYYLKVIALGNTIRCFFSLDGLTFVEITPKGGVKDDTFVAGSLGLALRDKSSAFYSEMTLENFRAL